MTLPEFINKMVLAGCPVLNIGDQYQHRATFQAPREVSSTFDVYRNTKTEEWVVHIPYMDAHPNNTHVVVSDVDQALRLVKSSIPA